MNSISRSALLQMLGWVDQQENEGVLRWSKPSEDMVSRLSFSVSQTPSGIKVCLDFDGADEEFNYKTRPIMSAEFCPFGSQAMRLAGFSLDGKEPDGEKGDFEKALEACAQAKASFQGKPKAMLLPNTMTGMKPGAKL